MNAEELNRLNELKAKYDADEEHKEYEELQSKAITELNQAKQEKTLLGEFGDKHYYLLLPYKQLAIENGKWVYKKYGCDMEITDTAERTTTLCCERLCNRDAKYFVDRFLRDREEWEKGHALEQA